MAFKDVYQTNTDTNSKNCTQGTARACVIMNGHFARTGFATFRQPIDKRRRAAIAAGFLKGIIGALGAIQMPNGTTRTPKRMRWNVMNTRAMTIPAITAITSCRTAGSKDFTAWRCTTEKRSTTA